MILRGLEVIQQKECSMKTFAVACMVVLLSSLTITQAQSVHPAQTVGNAGPDVVTRVTKVKGLKLVASSL